MSVSYILNHYGVHALPGYRAKYTGGSNPKMGTVIGTRGAYIEIRLDGDNINGLYHPTWELEIIPVPPSDVKSDPFDK